MMNAEAVTGTLVLRDSEIAGVQAHVRSAHGCRWLTFAAPPGTLWLGNIVALVVSGPDPRVISAKVVSRNLDEPGDRADRFEAVVQSDWPA